MGVQASRHDFIRTRIQTAVVLKPSLCRVPRRPGLVQKGDLDTWARLLPSPGWGVTAGLRRRDRGQCRGAQTRRGGAGHQPLRWAGTDPGAWRGASSRDTGRESPAFLRLSRPSEVEAWRCTWTRTRDQGPEGSSLRERVSPGTPGAAVRPVLTQPSSLVFSSSRLRTGSPA